MRIINICKCIYAQWRMHIVTALVICNTEGDDLGASVNICQSQSNHHMMGPGHCIYYTLCNNNHMWKRTLIVWK